MQNIIIINLKASFLPEFVLERKENEEFLAKSIDQNSNVIPIFDEYAVFQFQKIIDYTKAEIVISDDWFWTGNINRTKNWCKANNLNIVFHKNPITPKKMSTNRLNEIQLWIRQNQDKNLSLIIDDSYTTKNIYELALSESYCHHKYIEEYSEYIGKERRKSLIPVLQYSKYEHFKPSFGEESKKIVHISDKNGFTEEAVVKSWKIIKD